MADPTPDRITRLDTIAVELVGIVHGDGDVRHVARLVRDLDRTDLIGLAISCAAMVDPDRSLTELLAWMDHLAPTAPPAVVDDESTWTPEELRQAHNSHKAGNRTARVVAGNRIYTRNQVRARAHDANEATA